MNSRNLLSIVLLLFSFLPLTRSAPINADDGIVLPLDQTISWNSGDVQKVHMYGTWEREFYLQAGNNAGQLMLSPGDRDNQYWDISPWAAGMGIRVYNDQTRILNTLQVYGDTTTKNIYTIGTTQTDSLTVVNNASVWGNISATNLSGTNTGDQIVKTIIGANLVGNNIGASTTTYLAPYTTSLGSLGNTVIVLPYTGTLKNFYVRTVDGQPTTGTLIFTVYKNSLTSDLQIIIPAGSGANIYFDKIDAVSVSAGSRMTFQLKNNASQVSAGIAGVTVEYDSAQP